MEHRDFDFLEAGLTEVRDAPRDSGTIERIVARPAVGERVVLETAVLDPESGLMGDTWRQRGSRRTPDGSAHPGMQLTLMNARAAALIAGPRERWGLAGDQLYVDLDLGIENLPPGTVLELGTAAIEVTDQPHTGCAQFRERFGADALRFVNSPEGRALRLRGMNTTVIEGGTIALGDLVVKR
ncbi:MAG TPA: MOSC domain-containing protein [Acidimicrobiia bacterium]|nr:MOSC domain-containing protein [Acidimicrobiia bacterium]